MLRMGSSQLAVLDWNPGLPILEASTLSRGVKEVKVKPMVWRVGTLKTD